MLVKFLQFEVGDSKGETTGIDCGNEVFGGG